MRSFTAWITRVRQYLSTLIDDTNITEWYRKGSRGESMKVESVAVHKLFNLGNYENMKIELRCTVEEGDDVAKVYANAYLMIEKLFKATRVIDKIVDEIEKTRVNIDSIMYRIRTKQDEIIRLQNELRGLSDACIIRDLEPEEIEIRKLKNKKEIDRLEREIEECRKELEREKQTLSDLRKVKDKIKTMLLNGQIDEVMKLGVERGFIRED